MRQRTAETFKKFARSVPFYSAIPSHMFPELARVCKIEEVCGLFFVCLFAQSSKSQRSTRGVGGSKSRRSDVLVVAGWGGLQVGPNRTIFKEGDAGAKFYILIHGGAKVTCRPSDPKDLGKVADTVLATLTPGRYFGEVALLRDCPRTATVTTTARTVLMSITKESFNTFFTAAPEALADFEMKLARYDVQLRSVAPFTCVVMCVVVC
jgi:hypothetical protein